MTPKQTTLDLNGPILSFTQQPQSISVCDNGSATFVGIATALFPVQNPPNPSSNTGTLSYRWYAEGFGPLADGTFQGASITGSGTTTLTITNAKSPTTNGLEFYVSVDYVPSAYSQPVGSEVTVGTGRSTGNAINEILNSNTVSLTVFPTLSVATQPTEQTAATTITSTFTTLGSLTDTTQGSISYRWQLNGSDLSDSSTVTGSGSTTLSISLSNAGVSTVRAKLTHPTSCNSPIFTNTVNFNVVNDRQILNIETFSETGTSNAVLRTVNLFTDGTVTLTGGNEFNITSLYASEQDLDVIMDLYGSKGLDYGRRGGQGGKSTVRFTMKKNEEYVITRIPQLNGSGGIFIYRKSRLIIVCGAGGNAGLDGNGGDGGGVNVGGANSSSRGGGIGGILYSPGSLPSTGIFGSLTGSQPTYSGDTKARAPDGGRVLPCPRGDWARTAGYSACQDLGFVRFYRADGRIVSNTATIDRGFKAGYGIRQTAGAGLNAGGNGGGGATGGSGGGQGANYGGGGGGSGYHDGSITVISTQQGGHNGQATVIIRSAN